MTNLQIRRMATVLVICLTLLYAAFVMRGGEQSSCNLGGWGSPGYDPALPFCVMESDF